MQDQQFALALQPGPQRELPGRGVVAVGPDAEPDGGALVERLKQLRAVPAVAVGGVHEQLGDLVAEGVTRGVEVRVADDVAFDAGDEVLTAVELTR